jgi:dTDP-4-dehydrorhamnose reductase
MKIVVLGASGLVGSHVMSAGLAAGHDVVGTTRAADSPILRRLELGDWGATLELLEAERPEVVIYAAGWTWVDGCEADPSRSHRENFAQPLAVARWCAQHGVRMLYYSTSYVFDSGDSALIARLICVWGREVARKNFAYQVSKAAETESALILPSDQSGNPTWAGDVADWSVRLCERSASGVWHLAGPHPGMTRPDWAARILRGLAASGRPASARLELKATADLRSPATRPLLAGMDASKVQRFHAVDCREPEDLPADF